MEENHRRNALKASPGFQEITGMPTIRRLEFSGEDLDAAAAAGLE